MRHTGGMKPMDAIRSAMLVGAMTVSHAKDMGTIEPGKLANLVFVSENPLDDIANLKSVTLTVKRGIEYPRGQLPPHPKGRNAGRTIAAHGVFLTTSHMRGLLFCRVTARDS